VRNPGIGGCVTETVTYRVADAADAKLIASFAARTFVDTFGHLYPPEDLQAYLAKSYGADIQHDEIADPAVRYWLAMRGESIVGYAMAGPCELQIAHAAADRELYRLYVDRSVQGRGVADALMEQVLTWARAQGAQALWLSVWENNERAQRFYRGYGFTHMGEHAFMVGATADRDFIWKLDLREA
jgi:ribosomal protein S18 acetylase RimI-like enzyme